MEQDATGVCASLARNQFVVRVLLAFQKLLA